MVARPKMPKQVETRVLIGCQRRCCVCYFVHGVTTPKKGQIAHINKKPNDHRYENLVFLCFDHHDEFDSITSQSKNLTSGEILHYKKELIDALRFTPGVNANSESFNADEAAQQDDDDYINEPWKHCGPWPETPLLFPYKSPNRSDGVCRVEKIELSDGRVVVVCEQVEGNPGMSVTNAVEFIASQVCRKYEIAGSQVVWIEHYDVNVFGKDDWDLVEFGKQSDDNVFEDPSWRAMTPLDWEMLGLRLSPEPVTHIRQSNSRISKLREG